MENAKTQAMRTSSSAATKKPFTDVREGVETYLQKAEETLGNATQQVTHQYERAKEYVKDADMKAMFADVKSVVVKHPIISAAAGIGIGYIIGKFLTRSKN